MMPPFHPFHQFQGTHVEERRIHKGFGRTHLCAVVVVLFFIRVLTLGDRPASSGFRFVDTSPSFTCKKVCTCYVCMYTHPCATCLCVCSVMIYFSISRAGLRLYNLYQNTPMWGISCLLPKKNKSKVKSQ